MKKAKILYIGNRAAMAGGVGTVYDTLTSAIGKSNEFGVDSFIAEESSTNTPGIVNATYSSGDAGRQAGYDQRNLEKLFSNYDLIHIQGNPSTPLIRALDRTKKKTGTKIISTVHSSVKQEFQSYYESERKRANKGDDSRFRKLEEQVNGGLLTNPGRFMNPGDVNYWASAIHRQSKVMSLSDKVQHMNGAYKDDVIREYSARANAHKHVVLPHGVSKVDEVTKSPGKKRLLYMGRFGHDKGIDQLVDALPKILDENPEAEIRLVGARDDAQKERYGKRIRRVMREHFSGKTTNIGKYLRQVQINGWASQDEVADHYRWSDNVIVPSKAESFCLAAADALMHQRIPIVTQTKALDELYVSHGIAIGIPEDKRDGAGIAKVVNNAFKNSGSKAQEEMAIRGRRFAIENYSVDAMIRNQFQIYRDALGNDKPAPTGVDSRVNRYLNPPEDVILDNNFDTFTYNVSLLSERDHPGKGAVVKRILNRPGAKRNLEREIKAFRDFAGIFNNGKYKVPELYGVSPEGDAFVQQRLFGPNALEHLLEDRESGNELMEEIANWNSRLHNHNPRKGSYRIRDTRAFKDFSRKLQRDKVKFGSMPEFQEIENLVNGWRNKSYSSRTARLHGDLSPIHFHIEDNGFYGIDLDASRTGLVEDDIASFVSNSNLHFSNNLGDRKYSNGLIRNFVDLSQKSEGIDFDKQLPFFVGYYDYVKARLEPEKVPELLRDVALKLSANKVTDIFN